MADVKKILLADDEFHIRLMMASMLKTLGVEVVGEAKNGAEAVALFRSTRPDLLLMDINMPIKTGDVALTEIMAEFPDAKIIMLTSMTDMRTVEACLDAGALNFIRKDSPLAELKAAVATALE